MRVVVTGGAGFIGAHVCRTLSKTELIDDVVAIDDLSTGSLQNLVGVDAEFIRASILDTRILGPVVRSSDAVVHLAALPSVPRSINAPVSSHENNATGTVNVLEAAREEGTYVIVASSSSVYGANPTIPKHESLNPVPLSPYAASKLAAESYALAYHFSYALPVLPFRFFNVFGPLQNPDHAYAAVIPRFIAAALSGKPIQIHGDGFQSRDFTYVGTVASTICNAVLNRVTSDGPVNLAFGTRTTLLELVNLIEELLGAELVRQFEEPRPGDVKHSQADSTKLRELFAKVEPTSLREGLEQTIDWFRSNRSH